MAHSFQFLPPIGIPMNPLLMEINKLLFMQQNIIINSVNAQVLENLIEHQRKLEIQSKKNVDNMKEFIAQGFNKLEKRIEKRVARYNKKLLMRHLNFSDYGDQQASETTVGTSANVTQDDAQLSEDDVRATDFGMSSLSKETVGESSLQSDGKGRESEENCDYSGNASQKRNKFSQSADVQVDAKFATSMSLSVPSAIPLSLAEKTSYKPNVSFESENKPKSWPKSENLTQSEASHLTAESSVVAADTNATSMEHFEKLVLHDALNRQPMNLTKTKTATSGKSKSKPPLVPVKAENVATSSSMSLAPPKLNVKLGTSKKSTLEIPSEMQIIKKALSGETLHIDELFERVQTRTSKFSQAKSLLSYLMNRKEEFKIDFKIFGCYVSLICEDDDHASSTPFRRRSETSKYQRTNYDPPKK